MPRTPKPSGRKLSDKGCSLSRRTVNTRLLRPKFLIVCEGEKTEPNYFKCFRVNKDVIALCVQGLGDNTLSLVERTCELMQQERYAQVWCVLDRDKSDSSPAERFNTALALAQRKDIRVAYSNDAFELWYLLHFDYHEAAYHRSQYQDMLTQRLEKPYQKNSREMYTMLEDRQPAAIRNAERLLASYSPEHNPEKDNPCTTVHQLVQELNRYIR